MSREFTDEERNLIERHVLLPYAIYYLEQDLAEAKPGFSIEKSFIPEFKKIAQQEQFRVRNELRRRGIRVKAEKGWYQAEVQGNVMEKRMSADMLKLKVEKLMKELCKPPE